MAASSPGKANEDRSMPARLEKIREQVGLRSADGLLLTHLPDIRWACGFTGSNALLVVGPDASHFLSDGRYAEQARREVAHAEVHIPGYGLLAHAERERLVPPGRVLFQAEHVSFKQHAELTERFPETTWVPIDGLMDPLVAVKEPAEVEQIRRAQALTDRVFEELLGVIRPGMTERELAAEIVYRHLRRGASGMSFDPIVASGPNAALPHARPTERPIGVGDVLLLDFGCVLEGYASDMTRTVMLGEPGDEVRRVYETVRRAQERALETARAGLTTRELDGAARAVIAEAGYGEAFGHGLGHGIGLQTHEWPRVSYHTDDVLPAGAVVTIEPGIYLPGRFGVRIEDVIVLGEGGAENLTRSTKELVVL